MGVPPQDVRRYREVPRHRADCVRTALMRSADAAALILHIGRRPISALTDSGTSCQNHFVLTLNTGCTRDGSRSSQACHAPFVTLNAPSSQVSAMALAASSAPAPRALLSAG